MWGILSLEITLDIFNLIANSFDASDWDGSHWGNKVSF
jgi:hypothetical protein